MNLSAEDINAALIYWLGISQLALPENKHFTLWSQQFGLFKDGDRIWRCGGRLENVEVSPDAKHPVFLDKDYPLVILIMKDCHSTVKQGGVKATLTELCSRYWIVEGRNLLRKMYINI